MNTRKMQRTKLFFNSIWDANEPPILPVLNKIDNSNTIAKLHVDANSSDFENLDDFSHIAILNELKNLDSKKAPGPDGLPASVLKAARFELISIIHHLFILTITTGIVPNQWKEANIVPIPKEQRPQGPEEYRGIALTSTLCKVFERIMSRPEIGNRPQKVNRLHNRLAHFALKM